MTDHRDVTPDEADLLFVEEEQLAKRRSDLELALDQSHARIEELEEKLRDYRRVLDERRGEEEAHESGDLCVSCQTRVATFCTVCLLGYQLEACNDAYERMGGYTNLPESRWLAEEGRLTV